jgi:hypothetical protein
LLLIFFWGWQSFLLNKFVLQAAASAAAAPSAPAASALATNQTVYLTGIPSTSTQAMLCGRCGTLMQYNSASGKWLVSIEGQHHGQYWIAAARLSLSPSATLPVAPLVASSTARAPAPVASTTTPAKSRY